MVECGLNPRPAYLLLIISSPIRSILAESSPSLKVVNLQFTGFEKLASTTKALHAARKTLEEAAVSKRIKLDI